MVKMEKISKSSALLHLGKGKSKATQTKLRKKTEKPSLPLVLLRLVFLPLLRAGATF